MNVAYMEQLQKEATEKKLDSRAKWMLLRADLVGENTAFVHDPEFRRCGRICTAAFACWNQ